MGIRLTTDHLKRFLRRTWIGLAGVALSLAVALSITSIWGPLWDAFGWRAIAAFVMIAGFFALLAVEEFFRAPNPYTRVHPLFGLQDLGPAADMDGSNPSLLLAGSPLLVGAGTIILSFWLF